MRTWNAISAVVTTLGCFTQVDLLAQVTETDNNITATTSYVGCDGSSNQPLRLRTTVSDQIHFITGGTLRSVLYPGSTATINGFTNINQAGYWGFGRNANSFGASGAVGPFTRLHMADFTLPLFQGGFRPFHLNGITMTGNQDHLYIGQRVESSGYTTMLFQWSDSLADGGQPDCASFTYAETYNSGASAGDPAHYDGREIMRLHPAGRLGLGDWRTAATLPAERLDLLDGNLRIRALPGTSSTTDTKVMVVDNNGVVHWRPFADFTGAAGCEWTMNVSSPNHVYTAVGASDPDCPDEDENVGIGTATPNHKLTVTDLIPDGSGNNTACVMISKAANGSANSFNYTLQVEASQNTGQIYAAKAISGAAADGSVFNVGVTGYGAISMSSTNTNYIAGVEGIASGNASQSINALEGVRGVVNADYASYFATGVMGVAHQAGTSTYAGYFVGDVHITGDLTVSGSYPSSDAGLKQNIAPLTNAMDVIQQLEPKTYDFIQGIHPYLNLPSGDQAGLLAQEVDLVVPGLTKTFTVPAEVDSSGTILSPSVQYMGLNYTGLIPYLIGALKEQQLQITALQSLVMDCCSTVPEGTDPRGQTAPTSSPASNETKLTIQPNPFIGHTTLTYTLDHGGQMLLVVTTPSGRQVQVLREGAADAGTYTYEWETSAISSGMYYVTLLLDGEVVTKKAVKL